MTNHLNDTVWCKLAPSEHGVGVFAIRVIKKGTSITDRSYANLSEPIRIYRMNEEQFNEILPEIRELILDRMLLEEGAPFTFISPNADQNLRSFMNHSDDPNTDGIYATRDIAVGEEVTQDYGSFSDHPHPISRAHYPFVRRWG